MMKELLRRFAAWSGFFRCPVCMKHSGNGQNEICPECRKELPLLPVKDRCTGCGGPNHSALAVCPACMEFPQRPYKDALAVMEYTGGGRTLIQKMKFCNHPELTRPLALLALEKLKESQMEFDVIVPVPLHWKRFLVRSYNQTDLLAHLLSRATGKKVVQGLKKIRSTPHQSRLKKSDRQKNLKHSFALRDPAFAGKTVLLIDDVITTGATASAASQILLNNGAKAVKLLCCARTPLKAGSTR